MDRFLKLSLPVFISVIMLTGCVGKKVYYKPENLEVIPKETALQHIHKIKENGGTPFCQLGYPDKVDRSSPITEVFSPDGIYPVINEDKYLGRIPYSQWSASIRNILGSPHILLITPPNVTFFSEKTHQAICLQDNAALEKLYKALLSLGVQYSEF